MEYLGLPHDDYLEHHGVKGMKWGVRKQRRFDKRVQKNQRMYGDTYAAVYKTKNGKARYVSRGRNYQISDKTYNEMKKRGIVANGGDVKKDRRGEAMTLVEKESHKTLAGLAVGTAVATGAAALGMILSDRRKK